MLKGKIIGIALLVLFIGGGAFYYSSQKSVELQLVQAIENMQNLDSYTSNFDVSVMATKEDGKEMFDIGVYGTTNIDNERERGGGDFTIGGDIEEGGVTFGFSAGGEFVFVEEEAFIKIDNLPEMLLMYMPQEVVDEVIGEWIGFDGDIREELEDSFAETDKEIDEEEIAEVLTKMGERFWERDVVFIKDYETDLLDGKAMNKYEMGINPQELMDFIEKDVLLLLEEAGVEELHEISEEGREEILKIVEEIEENVTFHIWSDGEYVYRVNMEAKVEIENKVDEVGEVKIVMDVRYSNFNENFEIEPPKEYLSPEEVMDVVMGSLFSSFLEGSRDVPGIFGDDEGLSAEEEADDGYDDLIPKDVFDDLDEEFFPEDLVDDIEDYFFPEGGFEVTE